MFVGDFNSKLESFGCAKKNTFGPMLKNIQKQLNPIYLNGDGHTHIDRANGSSTNILDMAFVSPNLEKHDIQFQIGDDLGSDHLPIEIDKSNMEWVPSLICKNQYFCHCGIIMSCMAAH